MTQPPYNQDEFESLLMDYAAGMLNEAHHLFVSSYITVSRKARHIVAEYESLGGTLMETCEPVSMSTGSLDKVLDQISSPQQQKSSVLAEEKTQEELWPSPLYKYAFSPHWRYVCPGIKAIDIPIDNCRSKVLLLKAAPGARIPTHEHSGRELTLMLDGGMIDENDYYKRGDILIQDTGSVHTVIADPFEGYLSLNIIDTPVKHRGFYAFFDIIIKY